MNFIIFIKRHKASLIIMSLLLLMGIPAYFYDKSNTYRGIFFNYVFSIPQIDEMCRELDNIGVRYETLEGYTALAIHNKDRSRALLHLASKGLPRNPKTIEQYCKERYGDENWGYKLSVPEIPPNFVINSQSQTSRKYPEYEGKLSLSDIVDPLYNVLNDFGIQPPEIYSKEKSESREVRERRYHQNMVNDLADIISSIDGIEDVYLKVVPKPGSDCEEGPWCASIKLDTKPGFTLEQKQINMIEYLTSIYFGDFKIERIVIVDRKSKRLNIKEEDSP